MATHRNPDLTRQSLLQAAFQEIYKSGFQAASLDNILSKSGVTKGALYHHFGSKQELGYAVVDELIHGRVLDRWVRPLEKAENPIDGLLAVLRSKGPHPSFDQRLGCPLNNLAQEMSPLDEGFRKRLESVFREWREGIAKALRRGQEMGQVRSDVDTVEAADFFLAALEGSVSLAKNAQDRNLFDNCKAGLSRYLESLRAQESA
jgi:TetR/AcrR family transcriptional regulator, transcriptional repressor for nem operon